MFAGCELWHLDYGLRTLQIWSESSYHSSLCLVETFTSFRQTLSTLECRVL